MSHRASINPKSKIDRILRIHSLVLIPLAFIVFCGITSSSSFGQDEDKEAETEDIKLEDIPLLEREPFDVLVVADPNGDVELQVETFDFPDRVVPTGVPGSEKLRFRLVDDSVNLYEVAWRSIAEIKLFENMIMDEALRLTDEEDTDQAYNHFEYLIIRYPGVPNLKESYNRFLFVDAEIQFREKNFPAALAVYEELSLRDSSFRLDANTPSVDERISTILDDVIGEHVGKRDYDFARKIMARVTEKHGERQASVITRWEDAIRRDAETHRDAAIRHFEAGEGRKAHEQIRQMLNILPEIEGGAELAIQIMERYPLVLVAIDQPAREYDPQSIHDWAARRVGRMGYRSLVEFEGQGQDGGQYRFPYGRIEYGEDGKSFTFDMTRNGPEPGLPQIDAYQVSKRILDRASNGSLDYSPAWRRILQSVEIESASRIRVNLTQAHVLPEAMLQMDLNGRAIVDEVLAPNGFFVSKPSDDLGASYQFNPLYAEQDEVNRPEIVELTFSRAEEAIGALRRGDVDVIDRVFPGDLRLLRNTPGVTVERYSVPTVHMLVPNKRSEHMKDRSFRLALMMGIDRNGILGNSLLGGTPEPGFEVISGPFPIGYNDSDPINYGYNFRIDPMSYDFRLSGTMILLAESALKAMLEIQEQELPPRPTLVLAHPATDVAAVACTEIKRQWQMIGVECELRPLPPGKVWPEDNDYDLVYMQISMQEPLVQARTLLAEDGIVGSDNSSVDLALRQLDVANSWPAARRRLNELHTFVQNEVVVIPLFQTIEHYAYRDTVRGIGRKLISLYDNIEDWRAISGLQTESGSESAASPE